MNYDNHLFRVSSLPHMMPGLKTGKDVYESANSKLIDLFAKKEKYESEYQAIDNKTTKTAEKKQLQAEKAMDNWIEQKSVTANARLQQDEVFLSEGCETHLIDIYISNEFGRSSRDIKSKYLEKGIKQEDIGILSYGVVKGKVFEKNTRRLDDGFIMGEWDFDEPEIVYDTKCSWDIWTFYRNIKFINNSRSCPYFPNMQGYMKLLDKPKSKVVYTLVDTPKNLIEAEKKKLLYGFIGSEEDYANACDELEKNMVYSDIPINRRIIEIPIDRDEDYISNIQKMVIAARKYLNDFKTIYYAVD